MVNPSLSLRGTEVAWPEGQGMLSEGLVRWAYAENPGLNP